MLTVTSPPLKEVRELAQRSMCKGGMYTNLSSEKKSCKNFLYSKKSFYLCRKVIKLINV